ncbi:hypothetical protein BP6252_07928 [Coleophoma cylindrospora]|uniref:Tetratricopeptide repeat protein 36 n=1 Tax=Coleophoma cylindrospora TaxID=1849047 RepID=A0A3D8RBG8_9HELO|nr:hypothetical protein BP6252_07928 [Coleophoma cylindrospora]
MAAALTKHDLDVLDKIKDPESGPSAPILISDALPRDPHITDPALYQRIVQKEKAVIASIQQIELQIAGLKANLASTSPIQQYQAATLSLDALVEEFPAYASARNNRAQALRRIYGDAMLLSFAKERQGTAPPPLLPDAGASQIIAASKTVLDDLDTAISLLSPRTPFAPLSPQAAKTLAQAYTQRGALYHLTAKSLASAPVSGDSPPSLRIHSLRREAQWTTLEFEENASRDFMLGGRYGNEIARQLAVSTNPTAKLCGDMVREAMRKEYAGAST